MRLLGPSILGVALALSGCASLKFWESSSREEMAPLTPFTASTTVSQLARASVGKVAGSVLQLGVGEGAIYAASADGEVLSLLNGRPQWNVRMPSGLVAGVAQSAGLLVVAGDHGQIYALDEKTGALKWKTSVLGEVSGQPLIDEDLVLLRIGDAKVVALAADSGKPLWTYQRSTPPLSLRTYNGMRRFDRFIFAGFAGGKLVAIARNNGQLAWEGSVAYPKGATELERLADVVGEAVPAGRKLCAGAYQGRITCFDVTRGEPVWSRELSTPVGIDADGERVYTTDERGAVYALDNETGATLWKQDKLKLRGVGRPLALDDNVAVADSEGWVHLLDKRTGEFSARVESDGSPVVSPLQRLDNGFAVLTSKGGIYAFKAR